MDLADDTVASRFWHRMEDDRIQCDLCPRGCKLRSEQRGFCVVRANKNDRLVLTTYGRTSGFCIDPIEKKPLYHFLPGTATLSFGTVGCNLSCRFCQNWSISKSRDLSICSVQATPESIARTAKSSGCKSVAFTYNDPVVFLEYAVDVASACRQLGIKTVAVTSGYICEEPRKALFERMDAANVDLKGFTERFYYRFTGGHLAPVLDTLKYIRHETSVWLEITTLIIPGVNDSDSELDEMTTWIVDNIGPTVPIHFTAFHPAWKMRNQRPTSLDTLHNARRIAHKNGIRYAFTGNVVDRNSLNTYCFFCGACLITRNGFVISGWKLDAKGCCTSCGARCEGVFEAQPGALGSRRVRVRMLDKKHVDTDEDHISSGLRIRGG